MNNKLRIISGRYKSRLINIPDKQNLRPSKAFIRETLFNVIDMGLCSSSLDLFSGTGDISYEFGSRGAKNVTAVDQNRMCVDFIRKTSEILELNIQVIQMKVIKFLSTK